jgi:hypothetical protein
MKHLKVFSLLILLLSCQKEADDNIKLAGKITLSVSASELTLVQKFDKNTAITYSWSTGTNNGTGASISYVLQIDQEGNNFASPHVFDMGKAVYTKTFTVAEFNRMMVDEFGLAPEVASVLEARVIATVSTSPVSQQIAPMVTVKATPYKPVSTTLYLIGDASPNGWDATKAIALTPDAENPTIFVFNSALNTGSYKFITTLGQFLPSYNRGADDNHIIYRASETEPDEKFTIAEAGRYKITVNLLELSITAAKVDLPPYDHIYIVGSAAPNGWDIANATELIQDQDNPYIFTYMGALKPGEFKFPVNRNTDWLQDMYMKLTDSTMYIHHGGDPDDNKWSIDKKGHYILRLDLSSNTISISRTKLYIIGSATPVGWNISDAIALPEDASDGCIFTYSGPMVAGEFKFPVNRQTDWQQDMYMRVDDSHMYRHKGGDPDDNKWNITSSGNYIITANIETLTINIAKSK